MKRVALVLTAAAVAVLVVWCGHGGRAASPEEVRVERVVDGDTIRVRLGEGSQPVRLLGIDTPETHRPGTPIECGGAEASASMTRLARPGSVVSLEPDPGQDRVDRYGRLLAYVRLPGGRLAEEEQLRAGWAEAYVYAGRPVSRYAAFRGAEGEARAARRGVWGRCGGDFHSARR